MSFKEELGIEGEMLPRLATGFGAGIGRKGSLCGAFTGSIMVIGLKMGRSEAKDQNRREMTYQSSYRFWERFEQEFGSTLCYDLIGCRLDNEEERRKWLAGGGMETCTRIVEQTARILSDLLELE